MEARETVELLLVASASFATPGDEQDIATTHCDALRLFCRLELGDGDYFAGVKEVASYGSRNIEEDAAADDSVRHRHDRVRLGTVTPDFIGRPAAVHLTAYEHVREGVDVSGP